MRATKSDQRLNAERRVTQAVQLKAFMKARWIPFDCQLESDQEAKAHYFCHAHTTLKIGICRPGAILMVSGGRAPEFTDHKQTSTLNSPNTMSSARPRLPRNTDHMRLCFRFHGISGGSVPEKWRVGNANAW